MSTKEILLEVAEKLPPEATLVDAICELEFRQAALKLIEGWREANEHMVLGDLGHEHADFPGFEHRAGWKLLRALPLFSERLGLSGKADLVEALPHPASGHPLPSDGSGAGDEGIRAAWPVEYKRGRVSR